VSRVFATFTSSFSILLPLFCYRPFFPFSFSPQNTHKKESVYQNPKSHTYRNRMSLHKSWSQECLAFLKEIQEIPGDKIVEYESRMRFGSGDFDMDGEKLKSCEEDSLLEHWHRVIWRKDDGGGWVNVKRLTGQVKANGEPEEIVRR